MKGRAKSGPKGGERSAKRALARLATSLVGYANSVPLAPNSERDMSVGLAPGLDQPGPTSKTEKARALVRNQAQRRETGTRAKETSSGTQVTEQQTAGAQPEQEVARAQPVAGRVAGSINPAQITAGSRANQPRGPGSVSLENARPGFSGGGAQREPSEMSHLAQLRATLQAYRAALVAAGITPPEVSSGRATDEPMIESARGSTSMRAEDPSNLDPAATGGGGKGTKDTARTSSKSAGKDATQTARSQWGAPESPASRAMGWQDPRSKESVGPGPEGGKYLNPGMHERAQGPHARKIGEKISPPRLVPPRLGPQSVQVWTLGTFLDRRDESRGNPLARVGLEIRHAWLLRSKLCHNSWKQEPAERAQMGVNAELGGGRLARSWVRHRSRTRQRQTHPKKWQP